MALYRNTYRLLGFRLVVQTNQRRLGQLLKQELASYYPSEIVPEPTTIIFKLILVNDYQPPVPPSSELVIHYRSEKRLLELQLPYGLGVVQVNYQQLTVQAELAPQALEQGTVLVNWLVTIPLAELVKQWGLFFIHAAALTWNGKGVLFAGKSCSGKSTLTLALLSQGWQLVTDDEAFLIRIQEQYELFGCSARARLTYATYQYFAPWLGTVPAFQTKHTFDLAASFPDRIQKYAPLRAICLLMPGQQLMIERLHPPEAVPRLLNLAFLPGQPATARATFQFYSTLALQIPVYQLQFTIVPAALHQLLQKEVLSNLAD